MSNNVVILNSNNFDEFISNQAIPVLVDFWANWCMPCKMQAPTLDELANDLEGKAVIAKVNVDECEDLAIKYKVNAIPYLAVFKNGKFVENKVGLSSKEQLKSLLEKYM